MENNYIAILILNLLVVLFQSCSEQLPKSKLSASQSLEVLSPLVSGTPATMGPNLPEIILNKIPPNLTASNTVDFEFSSPDRGISFNCSLNGAPVSVCESPFVLIGLTDGSYQLEIRATRVVDGRSKSKIVTWQVQQSALNVQITSSFSPFTTQRDFSISFLTQNPTVSVLRFECQLDSSAFVPCISPVSLANLAEGRHTFQVRSVGLDGTFSGTSPLTWMIDFTRPTISITSGPIGATNIGATSSSLATFTFRARDLGGSKIKSITCRLDSGTDQDCALSTSYLITGNGASHRLTITVFDRAGNSKSMTRDFSFFSDYSVPVDPPPDPGGGP